MATTRMENSMLHLKTECLREFRFSKLPIHSFDPRGSKTLREFARNSAIHSIDPRGYKALRGFARNSAIHSFDPRESKALRSIHCCAREVLIATELTLDGRMKALKEFEDSKLGVKGLIDSGLTEVPPIFFCPPEPTTYASNMNVPVIDIQGLDDGGRRQEIVVEIGKAMEEWGVFQLLNHGIPVHVMKNMLEGAREFHEQSPEKKLGLYSRENDKSTKFYASGDLFCTKTIHWKDTLSCNFEDGQFDSQGLTQFVSEAIQNYMNWVVKLMKERVSGLLSEALGLSRQHLASMGGFDGQRLVCHYYPACPEPHFTQGAVKHTDPFFLTVLIQDNLGGLQVLRDNQWFDVTPLKVALVIHVGDFLQLISNDKFQSVVHRVTAQKKGPRISTACFFKPGKRDGGKLYGPLKEITSEENPPKYRDTSSYEYYYYFFKDGLNGKNKALESLRL